MPLDDWTAFARATGLKAGLLKKLRPFITEKDESARPVEGEADAELRDTERVPFRYEGGISAFFEKEVLPFVPDAWIDESKTEIEYEDKDGERKSFSPRRYAYSYDFYIVINVNNPYFSEIRFQLNSSSVDNDEETLLDGPNAMRRPRGGLRAKAGGMGGGSLTSNAEEVRSSVEYRQYEEMGCEIRDALLQVRQQAREEAAAAAAPKAAVTCPYCGATTTPDASGCCEFCGGAING